MSAFPLDEIHVAALRWACENHGKVVVVRSALRCGKALRPKARDAITIPALAVPLVSSLLARADVLSKVSAGTEEDGDATYVYVEYKHESVGECFRGVDIIDIPALTLALIDAGTTEQALTALREAGR